MNINDLDNNFDQFNLPPNENDSDRIYLNSDGVYDDDESDDEESDEEYDDDNESDDGHDPLEKINSEPVKKRKASSIFKDEQIYKPRNQKSRDSVVRYNIPKNHVNQMMKIDGRFVIYPEPHMINKIYSMQDEQVRESIAVYNLRLDDMEEIIESEPKTTDNQKKILLSQIPPIKSQYLIIGDSCKKTKRYMVQQLFELTLYEYLLSTEFHVNAPLKQQIEDIYVLYLKDLIDSEFGKPGQCCFKIPILVSSGFMMDVTDLYNKDITDGYQWHDVNGNKINLDFNTYSYVNRFLSILGNMGLDKIHMSTYIKKQEYVEAEFIVREGIQLFEQEDIPPTFTIKIHPMHFTEILIPFLKSVTMWDDYKNTFIVRNTTRNDFPILTYRQFKLLMQSATTYDKKVPSHIMMNPVTSVKNSFTIDFVDFEEYDENYVSHDIDFITDENRPLDIQFDSFNKKNKGNKIVYEIGNEYYIPNYALHKVISNVVNKTCKQMKQS